MQYVGKVIGTAVSAFIVWLVYYLTLPPLSLAYFGGFLFFAFIPFVFSLFVKLTAVFWAENVPMWVEEFKYRIRKG